MTTLGTIQVNQNKLDACKQHKFEWPLGGMVFGQKMHCVNCKGDLNVVNAFHYAMGFQAAGGNPNDVIEDFRTILPK